MNHILVLDLQTRRSFEDVGGKKAIHDMGIAVATVYQNFTDQISHFFEDDHERLILELKNSSVIFGISLNKFIFRLLNHFANFDLNSLPNIDLINCFKQQLHTHDPLQGLFLGTLGRKKFFYNETHSPKLFKLDKLDEIKLIGKQNVEDLNRLLQFGLHNGYVYFLDAKGLRWKIAVDWNKYG